MMILDLLPMLAAGLYMTTMSVVGIRLLSLARRNRALPEFYIGTSVICGGVLGASLEGAAMAVASQATLAGAGSMLLAGKIFGLTGLLMQGLFIRRVFRAEASWAAWLVGAIVGLPLLAMFGFAGAGSFATGTIELRWFALEFVGRLAGSVWLVVEASRYHAMMRRRLALGLADPVVTNRFALWAGAGVCSLMMFLTSIPPAFLDASQKAVLIPDLLLFSACGAAASFCYGLAFFPPVVYRQRLQRAALEGVG